MPTEVTVAVLAIAVGVAMVMMGTAVAPVVATIVVVVLGARWWRGFHGGVYTTSRVNDLGLSS